MKYLTFIVLLTFLYSCTSVSVKDVKPASQGSNCDTAKAVTFSGSILPIIDQNCQECHGGPSPSSGINLTNYSQISKEAKNGNLYGNITGAPGYEQMPPQGPPLSSCDIATIKKWIDESTPNN